jgi:hypothetical protein
MDGNVPCLNLFSEENQDWHLEDLNLIQTQQLIFSNKPVNSSNNRFADAVSTTEFEKRISDRIPKKKKKKFLYQEKMHFFP